MSPEELLAIISRVGWSALGEGASNRAFISNSPFSLGGSPAWSWVIKRRKSPRDAACHSDRMLAKWRAINPEYPAYKISGNRWIVPYLGKTPAPDDLRAAEVLRIYLTTRNIIVDASVKNNFLLARVPRVDDPTACKAVCIDPDYAWRPRRGSVVSDSDSYWDWEETATFLGTTRAAYPLTTSLVHTLLYIENHLKPDEIKDIYIVPDMMAKLRYLRLYEMPLTADMMEAFLSFSSDDVRKFIPLFKFLNTNSHPLTPNEIKNLLKIIKLDTANEIPSEYLRAFLSSDPLTHYNAIHLAAELCLFELTKNLITQNPLLSNATNRYKVSPLHKALEKTEALPQRIRIIELLLVNRGEVNLQIECEGPYNEFTPLDIARAGNHPSEIQAILRAQGALTHEELSVSTEHASREESPPSPASSTIAPAAALATLGLFGDSTAPTVVPPLHGGRPRASTF